MIGLRGKKIVRAADRSQQRLILIAFPWFVLNVTDTFKLNKYSFL